MSRFDLVCSRVGLQHLLGSVMMVGLMLGSLVITFGIFANSISLHKILQFELII